MSFEPHLRTTTTTPPNLLRGTSLLCDVDPLPCQKWSLLEQVRYVLLLGEHDGTIFRHVLQWQAEEGKRLRL